MGFSDDLRLTDSRKIQSTALNEAISGGDQSLHVAVHAHSAQTVLKNYIINPTLRYELGTALLHESLPVDEETREQDEAELAEMQANQRKLMLQIQQRESQQRRSGRTVGPRQSVSNSLRNEILYAVLECKDPIFTKMCLCDIPENRGGRRDFSAHFDNILLKFIISQPKLYQLAMSQMNLYTSVRDFCRKVHSSLKTFNRTAVTQSPDGVNGNFLAFPKKGSGSAPSVSTVRSRISRSTSQLVKRNASAWSGSDESRSPVRKHFKRIQRPVSSSDEGDTPVNSRPFSTPIKPDLLQSLGVESPVIRTEEYLKNLPDPRLRYTPKEK